MFFYDKDVERMMQLKKQEIMREMETAKKRILEELMCVKRSVHTDFCDLLADYNRIDFQMKQILDSFETKIKTVTAQYSEMISLKFAEYNDMVVDKVEQLEILEREIELYFSNQRTELETMRDEVQRLIDLAEQYNQAIENGASKEDLATLRAELIEMINNIDVSEQLDGLRTEVFEKLTEVETLASVQSDWNENDEASPSFIKNRTHYYEDGLVEILPHTVAEQFRAEDSPNTCYIPCTSPLKAGKEYAVVYNGVRYSSIAINAEWDGETLIIVGNTDLVSGGDNGQPFLLQDFGNGVFILVDILADEPKTVSIYEVGKVPHKIDPVFLPSPDWNETDETKGTFIKNKPVLAQSDWAENNEESASHIKNRTHYELYTEYKMLFGVVLAPGVNGSGEYSSSETSTAESSKYDERTVARIYIAGENETVLHDFGYITFSVPERTAENVGKTICWAGEYNGISLELWVSTFRENNATKQCYGYSYSGVTAPSGTFCVGTYTKVTKTLEAYFLANGGEPGSVLVFGENGQSEWSKGIPVYAPNGTKYIIGVTNEGALTATLASTE